MHLVATPSVIDCAAPALGQHSAEQVQIKRDVAPSGGPRSIGVAGAESRSHRYPLEGLTVVELAYFLAAPLAGVVLADLGARIIKLEPISGDPWRRVGTQAAPMMHGKQSIALDLKSDEGKRIFSSLLGLADVFYTSLRPQALAKLGGGTGRAWDQPRDLYLFAASYGSKGPWSQRAAFTRPPNALCGAGILQAGAGNPPWTTAGLIRSPASRPLPGYSSGRASRRLAAASISRPRCSVAPHTHSHVTWSLTGRW